ncbi:unnamed protein product [Victoria cruziana]
MRIFLDSEKKLQKKILLLRKV